jgi:hypothetical protein
MPKIASAEIHASDLYFTLLETSPWILEQLRDDGFLPDGPTDFATHE